MDIKAPSPMTTLKNFTQLQSDLNSTDGRVTQGYNNNNYPSGETVDQFTGIASRLDDSTMDLRDLHPERKDLLAALKSDTLNIAQSSGNLAVMHNNSYLYGSGWSSTLDKPIADVRSAVDAASSDPAPNADPAPNPLKLVKALADIQGDLSHQAGSIAQSARQGNVTPNNDRSSEFYHIAENLYDARAAMRTLHPEQTALLDSFKTDILHIAEDSGRLHTMYRYDISYGSGWATTLDRSVADVRKAIEILTQ